MKKLISFICIMSIILVSMSGIVSNAAVRTFDGENGELVLTSGGTWSEIITFPDDFTFKFTMKMEKLPTDSSTVQLRCGAMRYGIYISATRISIMGGTAASYSPGNGWHDYRFEVKNEKLDVYVDNQLIVSSPGQPYSGNSTVYITCGTGGEMRFSEYSVQSYDGKIVKPATAAWNGDYFTPKDEYTPGFTTDWKGDLSKWYISDSPVIKVDKEEGTLTFNNEYGIQGGFYCAQYPVTFAENFDWEWKMKIPSNVNGQMMFKFLGDGLNSYFYIEKHNKITGAESIEEGGTRAVGIPIFLGEDWGEWIDMKFERRGDYYNLYVNGGKVRTLKGYPIGEQQGTLGYNISGVAPGSGVDIMVIGEMKYTPYLQSVDMVKPYNHSEYAEGTDVTLQAEPQKSVNSVDYYVDGLKVGTGYAPDYRYILKDVKVGSYQVSAGVGNERSVPNTMKVVPAFGAELVLDRDEIRVGESVGASMNIEALNSSLEPTKVEYYLNNRLAATSTGKPFKVNIKPETLGGSTIYAKASNASGTVLVTEVQAVNVVGGTESSTNFNREYDVQYDYTAGEGSLNIEDGYFGLSMKHSGANVTYQTRDGEETYALNKVKDTVTGYGDYRVVVTAGFAEVYYNGQFAFSFYMPNDTSANKIEKSGIENFQIDGRGNKATYFEKKWESNAEYKSEALPEIINYSVEFDKTDLSDETFIFYDGRYRVQIQFKDGKVTVHDQGKVGSEIKESFPLSDNPAEPGYYRLTVSESTSQLWCNNKLLGGFVAPLYAHKPQIIRQMSNPSASTFIAVKGTDDTYYFSEDFSGNKEMQAADYWVANDKNTFKKAINNSGDDYFMTLEGSGKYWLNAITRNVDFKSRVKVDSADEFYFLTRLFETYYDMKVGYDFKEKCWYAFFDGRRDIAAGKKGKVTNPGEFELGVWHDLQLIVEDSLVSLIVDGKSVLDKVEMPFEYSGFTGFGGENAKFSFTDVEYVGRGKVNPGMLSHIDNSGMGYGEFIPVDDGQTIALVSYEGTTIYTSDNGATWSAMGPERSGRRFETNTVLMPDGRYVKVTGDMVNNYASESLDGGLTWTRIAQVTERPTGYRSMVNANLVISKSGKLITTTDEGGSETSCNNGIFYSDDGGYTWKESETYFAEAETGINLAELAVIDLPQENAYRVFGRTDRGFVYQADSFDGCKTFGELKPSPLPMTSCTAKIRRDLNAEQTYYAIWAYDTEACWHPRYSIPRNRFALAVSYDGMKTWEFVQTLFEIDDYPIGLVRNVSLDVFGDSIYIKIPGHGTGANCENFVTVLNKNKIKSTKRFEELHQREFYGTTADREADVISVLPKESGEAFILGNYENISVQGGNMYQSDILARVFSAKMTKSGNSVTFGVGDGSVVFTEGATSYVLNGETVDFGAVCMQNGYVNIEALAKAFGKLVTKCEKGWVVWADAVSSPYYREQLENLI